MLRSAVMEDRPPPSLRPFHFFFCSSIHNSDTFGIINDRYFFFTRHMFQTLTSPRYRSYPVGVSPCLLMNYVSYISIRSLFFFRLSSHAGRLNVFFNQLDARNKLKIINEPNLRSVSGNVRVPACTLIYKTNAKQICTRLMYSPCE